MSFSRNHQVLPVRERIADMLRRLGLTAKQIARSADVTERTVENWKAATTSISADAVVKLCRENDAFWREFCAMCERPADADAAARFMDDFNQWRKIRRQNVPD